MYLPEYLLLIFIPFSSSAIITARRQFEEFKPQKRQIETCIDLACIDSYISEFASTADAFTNTAGFDPSAVVSEISSLQSGLTSLGITSLTSFLPDPSDFANTAGGGTAAATSYSGPYVSDIVNSYSDYTKTRTTIPTATTFDPSTKTASGGFTFDTSSFDATKVQTTASTSVVLQTTSTSTTEKTSATSILSSQETRQSTRVVILTTTPSVPTSAVTLVQTVIPTSANSEAIPTPSVATPSSSSSSAGAGTTGVGVESWVIGLVFGLLGIVGL